jgi:hypothetical protein
MTVRADSLVGWSGGDPVRSLEPELREAGFEPLIIGDAQRPRRVWDATVEAKRATDALVHSKGQLPKD